MATPKEKLGRLGSSLSSVLKSDFFTFFHLREVESEAFDGETEVTYKPQAPQFHQLVTVILTVDGRKRVRMAQLNLRREFIADPANGMFASDIAKSFLLVWITDPDASPEVQAAADAIRRLSRDDLETSEALRVYAGMQASCILPLPTGRLEMGNLEQAGEDLLFLRAEVR